jgi:NADH-quinone oxidoreductase subunit H
MTTSISAMPPPSARSTGAGNWIEIFKFARLCLFWIAVIFVPVWLASWAVGELVPLIIMKIWGITPAVTMAVEVFHALVPLIAVMVFIPINAMFMVLCERRALALFTVRKGPNRVGFDGWAQTAADAVKLLFKEDITPDGADPVMFTLAPIIFFAPSIFGAIPLLAAVTYNHPFFLTTALPTGIFYILAMSSLPVVALVMGGWASNNKYSLVGGLRSAAQAISYEIPLVLSLITMCYLMGTLDVSQIGMVQSIPGSNAKEAVAAAEAISNTQSAKPYYVFNPQDAANPHPELAPASPGILQWNLFGNGILTRLDAAVHPLQTFACLAMVVCCFLLLGIYMTGGCAEINRIPFDLPEAESELVSGYNTEYSGIKFAIFFLAEFTNLFIVATIASVMFLGAGASPIPWVLDAAFFQQFIFMPIGKALMAINAPKEVFYLLGSLLNPVTLSAWFWITFKIYSIVLLAILVRGTLPRFRIDQLMAFGWKRLIPLSLILFLAMTFLKEMVVPHA